MEIRRQVGGGTCGADRGETENKKAVDSALMSKNAANRPDQPFSALTWQLGCVASVLSMLAFCTPGIGISGIASRAGESLLSVVSVRTRGLSHGGEVSYLLWTCEFAWWPPIGAQGSE